MNNLDLIRQEFEIIKSGKYERKEKFFDAFWTNPTRLTHWDEAQALLKEIYAWADDHATEDPSFYARVVLSHAFIEFLTEDFDSASKFFDKSLDLYGQLNDQDGIASTHIGIGFMQRSKGDIDLALKYGLPALDQLRKSGKMLPFRLSGCYWIGGVYADTGHYDDALKLFNEGLSLVNSANLKPMSVRLINGIAGVYMKQKNYSLALENYQKALDQADEETESTFIARGLTDLGNYHYEMSNFELSIDYNEKALALRRQLKLTNGSITNLINLATVFHKQGKNKEAITNLNEALKLAEQIRVKVKMYQIHQLLSEIYLGMGNVLESLGHYKAYHEIREDVNHDDLERKVKNQVQLFQAQQTQKENEIIKAQKVEIEKKNIELQETIDELTLTRINRKAKVFTLGIAIVLFIFAEQIIHVVLHLFNSDNYWLVLATKMVIIFSLKPIDEFVQHYLIRKIIGRKPKVVLT